MARVEETYTPGYSEPFLRLMRKRSAAQHAAFFTPWLRPGMRVLDCGCGPGTVTLDLARLVCPGQVVGIDLEATQLVAAQRAMPRQTNAWLGAASIYNLPFANGQFDAVFSHALFEHLREPVQALSEVRRVLRPSGLAGIRATDWGGWLAYPPSPLIEHAFDLMKQVYLANGGDPLAGRALKGLLRECGFSNVSISASYEIADDPASWLEWLAGRLELSGHPQLKQNDRELRAWIQNPDALIAIAWFEGLGIA
jgi:SAM-dependent methyltransferase